MAVIALQLGVRARDGEADSAVIEVRGLPSRGVVALLTSLRETKRDVIRTGSFAEVVQVTTHAGGWRSFVFPAQVAGGAVESGMSSG